METGIVIAIIAAAGWYLLRRNLKRFNAPQSTCGCGCSGCDPTQSKSDCQGPQES